VLVVSIVDGMDAGQLALTSGWHPAGFDAVADGDDARELRAGLGFFVRSKLVRFLAVCECRANG
jgi:hypothetical protein